MRTSCRYLKRCHAALGPDSAPQDSMRKLVVTAVPARFNMMFTEQYFSWESSIARATFASFFGPLSTYVMWSFSRTAGGPCALSDSSSIRNDSTGSRFFRRISTTSNAVHPPAASTTDSKGEGPSRASPSAGLWNRTLAPEYPVARNFVGEIISTTDFFVTMVVSKDARQKNPLKRVH